jgi:hypothetical protein
LHVRLRRFNTYPNTYCKCYANSDTQSYAYSQANANCPAEHNPEDTPYTAPAPVTLVEA